MYLLYDSKVHSSLGISTHFYKRGNSTKLKTFLSRYICYVIEDTSYDYTIKADSEKPILNRVGIKNILLWDFMVKNR